MKLGIMQGRLLPRYNNRYQAHPLNYWQAEFYIAKELSFSQIEFILDYNDYLDNPLMTKDGIKQIKKIVKKSAVKVKSICADYFMEAPLHSKYKKSSEKVLKKLIKNASKLNVVDIVIPCVDQSSLKNEDEIKSFVESIKKCLPKAEKYGINLNFETDLNPSAFSSLLNNFDSKHIKVNYDIGNSASLGYNPEEEFSSYGKYISDLHIKDRVLHGSSVPLGTGNADFEKIFQLLKKCNFKGNITLQAAREENYVKDLELVSIQRKFASELITKYLSYE